MWPGSSCPSLVHHVYCLVSLSLCTKPEYALSISKDSSQVGLCMMDDGFYEALDDKSLVEYLEEVRIGEGDGVGERLFMIACGVTRVFFFCHSCSSNLFGNPT